MVSVELTGGLGNQMFQYAVGFALARRRGTRLALDLRHYEAPTPAGLPPRPYELGRLSVSAGPVETLDRLRLAGGEMPRSRNLAIRAIRKASQASGWARVRRVVDAAEGFDARLASLPPGDVWLSGCWQSERYFAGEREAILREFTFRAEPDPANRTTLGEIESARTAVCVHVRRGDYTRPETLTRPCDPSYYSRALAWMADRAPGATHFVFSDDPAWARDNLPVPPGSTFVTHNVGTNDPEDLRLMARCTHFVIANSTFSWWAAWLGRSPGKLVVAPARWYARPHASERDLVPVTWARL
jgi:hypothetical protein